MAVQRHPVDSYDPKINFWEEFPDYKAHKLFGIFWAENKKAENLQASSDFMWLLTLCYDRKSNFFPQPDLDKWEATSETLFDKPNFMLNLNLDLFNEDSLQFAEGEKLQDYILAFEASIDSPLGVALRLMERKLTERTQYMMDTKYSASSAASLDKMFEVTDKIASLINKAMDNLRSAAGQGITKGGQKESLSDGDNSF